MTRPHSSRVKRLYLIEIFGPFLKEGSIGDKAKRRRKDETERLRGYRNGILISCETARA